MKTQYPFIDEENLSDAAKAKINEKISRFDAGEIWNDAYLNMLKRLATKPVPDLDEVVVKGQGDEAWDKSYDDHEVAVELQTYAIAELTAFAENAADLTKYPSEVSMDEFLTKLMTKATSSGRKKRFNKFLLGWAENRVDEAMELHSAKMSRAKHLARIANERLSSFGKVIPPILQHDLTVEFRAWSATKPKNQNIAKVNRGSSCTKLAKMEKMIQLLPEERGRGYAMENWEWRRDAFKFCDIPGGTFEKYLRIIRNEGGAGMFELVEHGKKFKVRRK